MSEKFDIEKLLRDHLTDASEPSPPDVFERIDAQLSGNGRRKKRFFMWFWFGTGMVLLSAGIFFTTRFQSIDSTDIAIEQNETTNSADEKDYTDTLHNELVPNKNRADSESDSQLSNNNTEDKPAQGIQDGENQNKLASTTHFKTEDKSQSTTSNTVGTGLLVTNIDTNDLKKQGLESSQNTDNTVSESDSTNVDNTDEQQNKSGNKLLASLEPHDRTQGPSDGEQQTTESSHNSSNGNGQLNDSTDYVSHLNPPQIDTNETTSFPLITDENTSTSDSDSNIDSMKVNPNNLSIAQDTVPSNFIDTTAAPIQNRIKNSFGLLAYGGYLAFDQAVFKSYFTSGNLSKNIFPSMGYEIGFGGFYRFKNRFEISLFGNYGERQSQFNYDLMVSQDDFLNNYENDIEIPLENLDDPNSCNCFLAKDANLDYKIQTVSIAFSANYNLIQTQKYRFGPSIGLGLIANTKFTNQNSSIISFSPEIKEQFIGSVIRMGFNLNYLITPKIEIGFAPSFNFQFANGSEIYAKNSRLILVPLQLKLTL